MPNYILSRTSPPAHIYERKINLGYGIKVDTSDAPQNQAQKGKEMNDAKEVLDVADKPNGIKSGTPVNPVYIDGTPVATAAFADGTVFENNGDTNTDAAADLEAKAHEEAWKHNN